MLELLELCGFDEREGQLQLPRMQKAFARLGITEDDIRTAKERLHLYYDMELPGVRRMMGVLLKDMVDIVLLRTRVRERSSIRAWRRGSRSLARPSTPTPKT